MANLTGEYVNAYDLASGNRLDNVSDLKCPCCGSDDIDYAESDGDGHTLWQRFTCSCCNSEFEFHYNLDGIYVINDNR